MACTSQEVLCCSPNVPQPVLYICLRVSRGFCASEKVLWKVPPTILYISLPNGCCFKKFFRGFRQLCFTFTSQSPPGVKVAWIVEMSQPYKSSPDKTTHHVVAVGVFFGLVSVRLDSKAGPSLRYNISFISTQFNSVSLLSSLWLWALCCIFCRVSPSLHIFSPRASTESKCRSPQERTALLTGLSYTTCDLNDVLFHVSMTWPPSRSTGTVIYTWRPGSPNGLRRVSVYICFLLH